MSSTNVNLSKNDSSDKSKRFRRTRAALERDVDKAINQLLEEIGFANITIAAITERADIEASVLYRRFANLEEIINHNEVNLSVCLFVLQLVKPINVDQKCFRVISHILGIVRQYLP